MSEEIPKKEEEDENIEIQSKDIKEKEESKEKEAQIIQEDKNILKEEEVKENKITEFLLEEYPLI